MDKALFVLIIATCFASFAFAISPSEFISSLNYSVRNPAVNVTNYSDSMLDRDGNGINDTLAISIVYTSNPGNYTLFTDLQVNGSVITASANRTALNPSTIVLNYSSYVLDGSRFNYSIRIYDANLSLRYRERGILANSYGTYQLAYTILNVSDSNPANTSLLITATFNVTNSLQADATVSLKHNSTTLSARTATNLSVGLHTLIFSFDNETVKNTHLIGNFTVTKVKINGRQYTINHITRAYDYRDFATSSFVYNVSERALDTDADGTIDVLRLNTSIFVIGAGEYKLQLNAYDLYFNYIKQITKAQTLQHGLQYISIDLNGTDIYKRKLTGPYLIYLKLKQGNTIIDEPPRYTTAAYNFTQFEKSDNPELFVSINLTKEHLYGGRNASINVTIANNGTIRAYNIFLDVFDNTTFSQTLFISTIFVNASKTYIFNFTNISDTIFTAIADLQNVIEEENESDNVAEHNMKINRAPSIITNSSSLNITTLEQHRFSIIYSDDDNVTITWLVNGSIHAVNVTNFTFIGNATNAGSYYISVNVSDGFLSNSTSWNLTVIQSLVQSSPLQLASGSSSSGDGGCILNYVCGQWGACSNGKQTRNCTIVRSCGQRIEMQKSCTSEGNHAPVFILKGESIENDNSASSSGEAKKENNQERFVPVLSTAATVTIAEPSVARIGLITIAAFFITALGYGILHFYRR